MNFEQMSKDQICMQVTIILIKRKYTDIKSIKVDDDYGCIWVDSNGVLEPEPMIDYDNPADAMPIMQENHIHYRYDTCQVHVSSYFKDNLTISTQKSKLFRAAMIVFLMMNEKDGE